MSEHTPTPWIVEYRREESGQSVPDIVKGGDDKIIADVSCDWVEEAGYARVPTYGAERVANAALIARAPEMATEIERLRAENAALLEALTPFALFFSALERLTDLDADNHLEAVLKIGHQALTVGAFDAARAALARHKGET